MSDGVIIYPHEEDYPRSLDLLLIGNGRGCLDTPRSFVDSFASVVRFNHYEIQPQHVAYIGNKTDVWCMNTSISVACCVRRHKEAGVDHDSFLVMRNKKRTKRTTHIIQVYYPTAVIDVIPQDTQDMIVASGKRAATAGIISILHYMLTTRYVAHLIGFDGLRQIRRGGHYFDNPKNRGNAQGLSNTRRSLGLLAQYSQSGRIVHIR